MKAILLLCALFLAFAAAREASIFWDEQSHDKLSVHEGEMKKHALCYGSYDDTVHSLGWGYLEIYTNKAYLPKHQALCAGYLEAFFTHAQMFQYWDNYRLNEYKPSGQPPKDLQKFMQDQMDFTRKQIDGNPKNLFWKQQGLLMEQFDGLNKGYQVFGLKTLSELEVYMIGSIGDLEDLNIKFAETAVEKENEIPGEKTPGELLLTDCSALIRVVGDYEDIIAAHTTWRSYYAMLRIYKIYHLAYATTITMSSSPGFLHSKDDFYATGKGLIVMETTNSVYNTKLYDACEPESLLSWQRVQVANMFANTTAQWNAVFDGYNSGTYNNQWMVVDTNLFTPGQKPPSKNFFTICEQMPGLIECADVSDVFLNKLDGYWPSYNVPYLKDLFNGMGYPDKVTKYGDEFTYEHTPRANIFRRDYKKVTSVDTMKKMINYNDWQHDPLALNNPIWGIAARGDIENPQSHRSFGFGGVDGKVIAATAVKNGDLTVAARSGPTYDQEEPFQFSASKWANIPHDGLPDRFEFPWVNYTPKKV